MHIPYKIVLASASPRRRELLKGLGLEFETRVVDGIDESWPSVLKGEDIALHIAGKKADAYVSTLNPDELVITADTIVYMDGEVYGKPRSKEQAKLMLSRLSGRWHEVITGVTLLATGRRKAFAVTTRVKFCELTSQEIDYYVETFLPLDKAGSYGIQEWIGFIGIESIEGAYFNVVGLPVQRLYKELAAFAE